MIKHRDVLLARTQYETARQDLLNAVRDMLEEASHRQLVAVAALLSPPQDTPSRKRVTRTTVDSEKTVEGKVQKKGKIKKKGGDKSFTLNNVLDVLRVSFRGRPFSASELGHHFGAEPYHMSGVLGVLHKRGHLRKGPEKGLWELTKKGMGRSKPNRTPDPIPEENAMDNVIQPLAWN